MKTEVISATPVRNGELYPLSIEAYHVLGEAGLLPKNTELLYGLVYKKMPKSPIHAALIARLLRALAQEDSNRLWIRSEQPITCFDSEPEPDVSIVRGTEDDYLRAHPCTAEFVAEVCVTSHDYDRSKLRAYALAQVKECWLVLQPEKHVEVYRNPVDGVFLEKTIVGPGGKLTSHSIPSLIIDLDQLFRE
jgi:Uma2 family endonuclease